MISITRKQYYRTLQGCGYLGLGGFLLCFATMLTIFAQIGSAIPGVPGQGSFRVLLAGIVAVVSGVFLEYFMTSSGLVDVPAPEQGYVPPKG
jgi:hypothetical protein